MIETTKIGVIGDNTWANKFVNEYLLGDVDEKFILQRQFNYVRLPFIDIIKLPISESIRGYKFDRIYVQEGIDIDTYNHIITSLKRKRKQITIVKEEKVKCITYKEKSPYCYYAAAIDTESDEAKYVEANK